MTFFPIPDEFYRDPQSVGWSAAEYALWCLAGSWSTDRLTDGSVPAAALALFPGDIAQAADLLAERGVWKRTRGGGYQYVNWPKECSRSFVERRREQYRNGKREKRSVEVSAGRTQSSPQSSPRGLAVESTLSQPLSSLTSKPTSQDSLRDSLDGFDDFWAVYPAKKAKPDARKAWTKAVRGADRALILAGAKRYADERRGQDPKYTAYPATWLNRERWNDEPEQMRLAVVNGHQAWQNPSDQSVYDEEF